MNPFTRVISVFAALVLVLLVFIATRPATFHVERSTQIKAESALVFADLDDFHQWEKWSPWAKLDPQQKTTYSGAASGVGAVFTWAGNDKVGEGRMMITESKAPDKLSVQLDFQKPWESTSRVMFTLAAKDAGTSITWAMDGNRDFMAKAMSLVMDMDKMVGPDFEKGLGQLKTLAESQQPPPAK